MSQFEAGLDLVIQHLDARKRLLHQEAGVSREVLIRLVSTRNAEGPKAVPPPVKLGSAVVPNMKIAVATPARSVTRP